MQPLDDVPFGSFKVEYQKKPYEDQPPPIWPEDVQEHILQSICTSLLHFHYPRIHQKRLEEHWSHAY